MSSFIQGSVLGTEPQSTFINLSPIMQKKKKKKVCEAEQVFLYPAERRGRWGAEWQTTQFNKFESWRLDRRWWGFLASRLSGLRCVGPCARVYLICVCRRKTDTSLWMHDTCPSMGWKILLIVKRSPMRIPSKKFWGHRTFANVTPSSTVDQRYSTKNAFDCPQGLQTTGLGCHYYFSKSPRGRQGLLIRTAWFELAFQISTINY